MAVGPNLMIIWTQELDTCLGLHQYMEQDFWVNGPLNGWQKMEKLPAAFPLKTIHRNANAKLSESE